MPSNSMTPSNAVWFLVGPYDSADTVRCQPIYTLPFVIGRRPDLPMPLSCKTVSTVHAEIVETGGALVLRDLGSTNGTYVNGQRVAPQVALHEDDLVQFANMAFRVRKQAACEYAHTVQENTCDRALALVQFDKLMSERSVTPFFQPIVTLAGGELVAYEALARSMLFGLETPKEMFSVANQLDLEVELSVMLRWEALEASMEMPGTPHLFLNTHPRELDRPGLTESLRALREGHPGRPMTLEIHESAVADAARMAEIRPVLVELDIGLAYDDFGVGQSRLNELAEMAPACVKFDMSLIRNIDSATAQRQQVLATLVKMVDDLGIRSLAEGIETEGEGATCLQMGFELAQGFYYGRPVPASKLRQPLKR